MKYIRVVFNDYDVGVDKKIKGQLEVFKKNFPVDYIELKPEDYITFNTTDDILYIRYFGIKTFFLIRKLYKNNKIILEIPTPLINYYKEYVSKQYFFKKIFFKITSKYLFKYSYRVVEYGEEDNFFCGKYCKKIISTQNGIDVDSLKIKKQSQHEEDIINLISVANIGKWHGYDRIIKGIYNYNKLNKNKKIYYYCIGEGEEKPILEKLVKELDISENVFFCGKKTGKELDDLFDKCDIALGSLANNRKALKKDSALKNREYCSRSIPFVIASEDDDFKDFRYVLRVPDDESDIDIEKIIDFYETIKNKNYSSEMRKYASENLDWNSKLNKIIDVMK